jgi:GntR family transcriptional regulator/MocR family aminotransferase
VTAAVRRLCVVLRSRGVTAVACEEPGWTRLREVLTSSGLRVVPVPTDGDGIRVDVLRRQAGVGAVLVTPAHQFPTGVVLAPARRTEILSWAQDEDALVLEDDYDAEYRYDRDPVATLQGMDPARVVLLKSVSKMLSPALGIGWMAVPPALVADLSTGAPTESQPSTIDQLALAHLIESGGYDRHLRTGRSRYRQRRDVLVRELEAAVPGARITGTAAGLHLVLWLPRGTPTPAVVATAAAGGLGVTDLDDYRAMASGPPGLVLGYGNIATPEIRDAVRILAAAVASVGVDPAAP